MNNYRALRDDIRRIREADENYARHMWDEEKGDALNGFIEALADLATDVEFSILEEEMPEEEKNRLARLEIEEDVRQEVAM